jgi:hydrogenase expression/formation protein HypD
VQGFLAAGHVCTIMGIEEYEPLVRRYRVPIVVTGFEPLDVLQGVWLCVKQLEEGRAEVENQYTRSVRPQGNAQARALLSQVFTTVDRSWRGLAPLPRSGLALRETYAEFDAEKRFRLPPTAHAESPLCQAGRVLQGHMKPPACPAFDGLCTPEHPLGAPMVSSEGACAAYYRFGRRRHEERHDNTR